MLPFHSREALKQLSLIIPKIEKDKLNLSLLLLFVAAELEPQYTDVSCFRREVQGGMEKGEKSGKAAG